MPAENPTVAEIFDPEFLSALQAFSVKIGQVPVGGQLAEHRSKQRGQGLEFADYKPYVAGDDLRAVDWNIYRRLGRLFIKVFEEQQDMHVYVLLDVSASMYAGKNAKITSGMKAGMALSAIALRQHDGVGLYAFGDDLKVKCRSVHGQRNLMQMARHFSELEAANTTHLADAILELASYKLRKGVLVIISDFFDPEGLDKLTRALRMVRHRLLLVQLSSPQDADPSLDAAMQGDVHLRDSETGDLLQVSITPQLLERYRKAYSDFNRQITEIARGNDAGFLRLDVERDVLPQLSALFAGGGIKL